MNYTLTDADLNELLWQTNYAPNPDAPLLFENRLDLTFRHGTARFEQVLLNNGIHLIWGQADLLRTLRMRAESDFSVVELHFTLSGQTASHIRSLNQTLTVCRNQHNLFYAPESEFRFEMAHEEPYQVFEVHFVPAFFLNMAGQYGSTLLRLADSIERKQAVFFGPQNLPIIPAIQTVLHQIMHCPLRGAMKRLYLESKVMELLALQVGQYEQATGQPTQAQHHPPNQDKLLEARRILLTEFANPPTLGELSKRVGLNEFKLKQGYRQLFGIAIYESVLQHRMEQAHELLRTGGLSVSEVAYRVGYQHPAHFSTAFKKRFGLVPSQLIN